MPVQYGDPSLSKAAPAKKAAAPTGTDWASILKLGLAPPDYSGLAKTAQQMAGQSVGAQVAGIRAAQDQIRRDAATQAGQVTQASVAAAKYLQSLNLGGAVAGDYADAAAAQRAAAAGYSGGLQQTVGDQAAQVQQNLAGLGSTQQAAPNQAAAGNVLYGLGGNLPAQQLDVQGPLQSAQIRGLPAQTLGYGQQQATGILGAGQQEAGKYNADVLKAQAQRATLTAQYLSDLEDKARQAGQDRFANTLSVLKLHQDEVAAQALANYRNRPQVHGSLSTGLWSFDPATGKTTVISQPAAAQAKPTYYQDAYGRQVMIGADGKQQVLSEGQWTDSAGVTYRVGIDGSQTAITGPRPFAPHAPPAPPAPHYTTVSDATGTYVVNEDTGERRKVAGPSGSDASAKVIGSADTGYARYDAATGTITPFPGRYGKPASSSSRGGTKTSASALKQLGDDVALWHSGQTGTANGQPVIDPNQQLDYSEAVVRALARGIPARQALKVVNSIYPPGDGGRPLTPKMQLDLARRLVANAVAAGASRADAYQQGIEKGLSAKALDRAFAAWPTVSHVLPSATGAQAARTTPAAATATLTVPTVPAPTPTLWQPSKTPKAPLLVGR